MIGMPDQTARLLAHAKRFDMDALTTIYDRYSPAIYRYAYRLLGDANLAEDCTSETFHRFLRAIKAGGGPEDELKAYLYRIAHNWVTDYYRGRKETESELTEEQTDRSEGLQTQAESTSDAEQMRRTLMKIAPEQRQVLVYKFLEGWSNEEIASALNKTIGAVKALQSRGLESMQRLMMKEGTA